MQFVTLIENDTKCLTQVSQYFFILNISYIYCFIILKLANVIFWKVCLMSFFNTNAT